MEEWLGKWAKWPKKHHVILEANFQESWYSSSASIFTSKMPQMETIIQKERECARVRCFVCRWVVHGHGLSGPCRQRTGWSLRLWGSGSVGQGWLWAQGSHSVWLPPVPYPKHSMFPCAQGALVHSFITCAKSHAHLSPSELTMSTPSSEKGRIQSCLPRQSRFEICVSWWEQEPKVGTTLGARNLSISDWSDPAKATQNRKVSLPVLLCKNFFFRC